MILDRILGLFSRDMGIDLGTANTLVCLVGEGIALSEPSVVAVHRGTNRVCKDGQAVGYEAKRYIGVTPQGIQAIRPMKDGVIADFEITRAMLQYFIRKVHGFEGWRRFARPRVVIAVPSGITAVEKNAVKDAAQRAGAREVYLISEPLAAGLGIGLPIGEPTANMIVDIGGGTTEVTIISLGDIVTSESVRVAGDELDETIVRYLKDTYNLLIGERTAESIKIEIGSAAPLEKELTRQVKGRDLISGLPRATTINSEEIREALAEPVGVIVGAVRRTLEAASPELASDLIECGMWVTGGGALLRGLDEVLRRETGLAVHVADDPLTAVARGTGRVLEQLDALKDILESAEDEG
ncbi:MAG TPA: rod shape-determining protein [Candidatus Brocadiia bacterium]|nr:rod shape-determining protein [Candidatus Brocadiia bacterium]